MGENPVKKPKKRNVKRQSKPQLPILPGLSSLNIAKMLSHFMTFRSTIRDLSSSLQRMERMLDSTYQMFEIAQHIMVQKPNRRLPALPQPKSKTTYDHEDAPIINLPSEDEDLPNPPFAELFKHFDPQLLMQILKSPMVQGMLSQFLTQPKSASARIRKKQR